MKETKIVKRILLVSLVICYSVVQAQESGWQQYSSIIRKNIYKDYKGMYREAGGALTYPFITPGSAQYADVLWDWDSWLSDIALRQVLQETGSDKDRKEALVYEQGCVLNFLSFAESDGWVPILIRRNDQKENVKPRDLYAVNMHKPCLAQHAAFLTQVNGDDASWLRPKFYNLQAFVNNYRQHHRDRATGLYYWQNDAAIGVDNDPSTYYRPAKSSGSIYLNCFMYRELQAMVYLCERLNFAEIASQFRKEAEELKVSIQEYCWDERDGFFYSVDLNLLPIKDEKEYVLHSGNPRDWNCLIQRIGVWSGFLAMWADIATPEQAKRMVEEHYRNEKTFYAPYGVRTLSRMEKMYNIKATGNPSSWLGPVWGVSNYLTWKGLINYGFKKDASDLAAKTVHLFGRDFERFGVLHEYYQPENGEPVLNPGFQNWNYLVLNMLAWLEGKNVVSEFDPDTTTHKSMNTDQPSYKVIMFGNSLTANGKWSDGTGRSDIKNSGTGGFTTSHFVWIINDKVLQYKPAICFLEGGINDIGVGIPLERTYKNYTSLVDTLLAHKITPVIQSTLYTNFPNNASQTTHHNQMVESLNTFLKDLATSRGILYLDLNKFFSENKKLKPVYSLDGVHVNAEAYKIWCEEVKRVLKENGV